jgi:hypothetical protein
MKSPDDTVRAFLMPYLFLSQAGKTSHFCIISSSVLESTSDYRIEYITPPPLGGGWEKAVKSPTSIRGAFLMLSKPLKGL